MRIISGTHKGRRINPPKNLPVRPTTDFAKESLFNIMSNYFDFESLNVLDLFTGTGNISYEFASRGANDITSVDVNHKCLQFIKKITLALGFENINIIKNNAFKYLADCKDHYGIIFADPPYELEGIDLIAELVFDNKLLKNNGWLIIEHKKKTDFSKHKHFLEKRRYGEVNFSIFL
ncbi:MAG: RsmD family RNA methyltransferase [Bacteroidota bacterium]